LCLCLSYVRGYVITPSKTYVTCIPTARQRLGKHIPVQANSLNNRTSVARQRIRKRATLTIEAVFSLGSVRSAYKEVFGRTE
jgi:hypothetical protein